MIRLIRACLFHLFSLQFLSSFLWSLCICSRAKTPEHRSGKSEPNISFQVSSKMEVEDQYKSKRIRQAHSSFTVFIRGLDLSGQLNWKDKVSARQIKGQGKHILPVIACLAPHYWTYVVAWKKGTFHNCKAHSLHLLFGSWLLFLKYADIFGT